jgi:hypothetical protein
MSPPAAVIGRNSPITGSLRRIASPTMRAPYRQRRAGSCADDRGGYPTLSDRHRLAREERLNQSHFRRSAKRIGRARVDRASLKISLTTAPKLISTKVLSNTLQSRCIRRSHAPRDLGSVLMVPTPSSQTPSRRIVDRVDPTLSFTIASGADIAARFIHPCGALDPPPQRALLGIVNIERATRGVTPALSACRRPLHRRLAESGKAYRVTAAIARN